jgi:hypothetical protein
MKINVFKSLAICLALTVVCCSKNESEQMSSEVRLLEQASYVSLAKQAGPEIEWMLFCDGSCEECSGKGLKLAPLVYECQCAENCALTIARIPAGTGPISEGKSAQGKIQVDSLLAIYGTFQQQLEESLKSRYMLRNYKVEKVEVYATLASFALKYYIHNLDEGNQVTLVFVKEGTDPQAYEVDCNGGCVSAHSTCTERVTLGSPIQIDCTCEGECMMTVSPVEPELN